MSTWKMMTMQDPSSLIMLFMIAMYNLVMEVMSMVASTILIMMVLLTINKFNNRTITQNNTLEILWTIIPMIMLIYMAAPSLQALYLMEENYDPSFSIKVLGHQWYWSYEYGDFNISFDSYMLKEKTPYIFRLLDVDNRLIVPMDTFLRILCTSTDVIHSWALPSMGIKMDAVPGRINQLMMIPTFLGTFFGQCSEICGMNHSFMPIVLEITTQKSFISWIKSMIK